MGLVDGVAHSGSISVLDDLVVGLVSGSSGQEGRDSNKSLLNGLIILVSRTHNF